MSDAKMKTFEIDLDAFRTDKEKLFAFIMLEKKPSLRDAFEKNFNVTFLEENGIYASNVVRFTCPETNEDAARKAYAALTKHFAEGQHVSKELIAEMSARLRIGMEPSSNDNKAPARSFNDHARDNNHQGRDGQRNRRQPPQHGGGAEKPFRRGPYIFSPKTEGQQGLVNMIAESDVTFGIGPAGTGKTHVAIAKAVEAWKNGEVQKIFLSRPAISNGKDPGALPGGINEKLAPYMRPLYDELEKVLGSRQQIDQMIETGALEIAPVEFMRGRTFEGAYVILDEAQNCTQEQMRMALTRLGEGSKMIVTGDPRQIDLRGPNGMTAEELSGLPWALKKLDGVQGIGIQYFTAADVVRSPVVARIVTALDADTTPYQEVKPKGPQKNPGLG
jgi:phosphate starvation-inducible PhoH-like protein